MTDFLQRVATAWALAVVQRQTLDGPLVVVSHGLVIHAALLRHAAWAGIPQLPLALANTSVSIVDAAAPHRVLMVDDTRHLNDDNCNDAQALVGG
jgi:broad specificity phosphatase PhoE